jgi:hypothetical protein
VIIDGILTQKLAWVLVILGASLAVVMQLSGVSALAFAVGVYLPLSTTMPIFIGGLVRGAIDKFRKMSEEESDSSPAVLLSSGLIAGGSIAGILIAFLAAARSFESAKYAIEAVDVSEHLPKGWAEDPIPGLAAFGVLVAVLIVVGLSGSRSIPPAKGEDLSRLGEVSEGSV